MLYKINEKKTIDIPDNVIDSYIKNLGISKDEAIATYLDDEGYTENEQVEQLTQKAKENKSALVGARQNVENKKTERVKKDNPTKQSIIKMLFNSLKSYKDLPISNIIIENDSKIITFMIEDKQFKLDLIEKRQKK